jgi:hypothetical protein
MRCYRRRRRSRRCRLAQRGLGRRFFRGAVGLRGGFGVSYALQMTLHLLGDIGRNRTRVRLLFGDTKTCQQVNDGFRLDLQLARQLVNADLGCVAHAS